VALKALCPSMKAVSPERYMYPGEVSSLDMVYEGEEATPDLVGGVTET
jgi:hypothetical protein